jgi:hypothetical protein
MTENNSLDKSWVLCSSTNLETNFEDSQLSIISSDHTSENSSNNTQSNIEILSDQNNYSLVVTDFESFKEEPDSNDSYVIDINKILPVLNLKTTSKLEAALSSNKSSIPITKNKLHIKENEISNSSSWSNSTSKLNQDFFKILSNKQKQFLENVKKSNTNFIGEAGRRANVSKKEAELKAVRDEQTRLLIDKEESLNFNVDSKASVNFFYIPKRIAAPDYEPKIDIQNLIKQNQTEAQIMVSKLKEKNKNFINSILD